MHSHYEEEEAFHARDRKSSKRDRKQAQAGDRSKYKKSDRNKLKKSSVNTAGMDKGRVLSILGEHVIVDCDGKSIQCTLRGTHKKEKTLQKSLIAVGDLVYIKERAVHHIETRYSVLARADNLRRRQQQIIAANVDCVLITTAAMMPRFTTTLIDRYLIMTWKGNMEPVIVINKGDILKNPPEGVLQHDLEEAQAQIESAIATYQSLGIPTFLVSAETGEGIEELERQMRNKTSVFSGQSGVGKSSLINRLLGTQLRTQEIVSTTWKGSHTTTTAHLIPLDCGGFCVDTPGIKSFGVWELSEDELQAYFPEILEQSCACKFSACTHTHEPNCAVKEAVENGQISEARYASYATLLAELQDDGPQYR